MGALQRLDAIGDLAAEESRRPSSAPTVSPKSAMLAWNVSVGAMGTRLWTTASSASSSMPVRVIDEVEAALAASRTDFAPRQWPTTGVPRSCATLHSSLQLIRHPDRQLALVLLARDEAGDVDLDPVGADLDLAANLRTISSLSFSTLPQPIAP